MTVFLDELALPFEEGRHSHRLVLVGESQPGRTVLVVFTERVANGIIRIIRADEPRSVNGEPMPKETEPTKRSLREIPEVAFSKAKRLARGKYAAKARRSFAVAIVEPELFARFGSSEAVNSALRAIVDAADTVKYAGSGKRSPRKAKAIAA